MQVASCKAQNAHHIAEHTFVRKTPSFPSSCLHPPHTLTSSCSSVRSSRLGWKTGSTLLTNDFYIPMETTPDKNGFIFAHCEDSLWPLHQPTFPPRFYINMCQFWWQRVNEFWRRPTLGCSLLIVLPHACRTISNHSKVSVSLTPC